MRRCLRWYELLFPVHRTVTAIKLQTILQKPPDGEDNWPVVTKDLAGCEVVVEQWDEINSSSFYCHCVKTIGVSLRHRVGLSRILTQKCTSRFCGCTGGEAVQAELPPAWPACSISTGPFAHKDEIKAKSKNRRCFALAEIPSRGIYRTLEEKVGKSYGKKIFWLSQISDFGCMSCVCVCLWETGFSFLLWSTKLLMNMHTKDCFWRMNDALVHKCGHSRTAPWVTRI